MTEKDRLLQEQYHRIKGLEEELAFIVECCRLCRFCKNLDADCTPSGAKCRPEWRGMKRYAPKV